MRPIDADKIVKQLEEERELAYADFDRYVEEVDPCFDSEHDDFFHKGIERAIEVVKAGGQNGQKTNYRCIKNFTNLL